MAWDLEAHSLTLYNVAEVPIYVRRNPLDRQRPLGVLRTRPVESLPDLTRTMVTSPAGDAEERDVGGAGPRALRGSARPRNNSVSARVTLAKKASNSARL